MKPSSETPDGEVIVYKSPDSQVRVDVHVEQETVWLTQAQIAELFSTTAQNIAKHLKNIFDSGELGREATVSKMEMVQSEGGHKVTRRIEYFNLDAILSVGYRVNSKRGTQFRIWATRTLRERLSRNDTFNERPLREKGLAEMEAAAAVVTRALARDKLTADEGQAVLDVVDRYARAWRWLFKYDERRPTKVPAHPRRPNRP